MRKIINSTYVSLDGVIENPHLWPSSGVSDDSAESIQVELLNACDTMLMGRHTYDGFAPAWSARSGDAFSDRINSMRKYVVSSTLTDPEWNNTEVITGDAVAEVTKLKEQPGEHIVQYGFGRLSHTLMRNGLLDELRLWVHPLFAGTGRAEDLIFREGPVTQFTLTGTTALRSGIVVLSYEARKTSGDLAGQS